MIIELKKFGTPLISREAGSEALKSLEGMLKEMKEDENLVVDFTDVITFSPSWGDEFLTPIHKRFGQRVVLKNTNNPSVKATLDLLRRTGGISFIITE